jgi:hypothetical protein
VVDIIVMTRDGRADGGEVSSLVERLTPKPTKLEPAK